MVPPGGAGIGMHVIPVQKEVDMCNEAISLEKISYWLDKYEGKYAASPCSCRKSRKTFDEGCADDPADWCVAVGDMVNSIVIESDGEFNEVTYNAVDDVTSLSKEEIINKVKGVNRVVYDISSKPPATIEWE